MKSKSILPLLGAGSLLLTMASVLADDGWGESRRRSDFTPVQNPLYRAECGSCHFAYPPGLLPTPSWNRVMGSLNEHFGENAELDSDATRLLTEYLTTHAADVSDSTRSARIVRSVGSGTPLRITDVPYIKNKHKEIPGQLIANPKVGSLSNCAACHTRADHGSFRQKEVIVPGAGRWEWGFD